MTRLFVAGTTFLTLAFLAACVDKDTQKGQKPNQYGEGTVYNETPTPPPAATPDEPTPPPHIVVPNPNATPGTEPKVGALPEGKPVPGKPGFVTSPYSPVAGYVDVRGFPPGTEVKCPYTGKVFLVPSW